MSIALHLASLWKRWFGRFVRKYQLRTWRRDRHFYVVFQATRRSSRLQSKGSTVSSSTVVLRPWVLVRFREPNSRRPALQASGLPTELILLWSCWLFNRNFFVISKTKACISWSVEGFFVYLPCQTSKTKLICDLPPLVFALLCLTLPVQEHTKFKFLDDIPTFCFYRPLSAAQMTS